ncbi:unnamed protein product [Thelazia callipaeda]|uniref:Bm12874 n=1 Tax=Thelazia callipaeda TaxID=103827 RepID=A0A0N5CX67_THECL|nr:unnamed protein product [Thelazia callipaeda]
MENSSTPKKPLVKYIRQLLALCEQADVLINEDDHETLIHPEIHLLRSKVIKLCKVVLSNEEWGRQILDRVWRSCYYSTICRIRRAALSVEQKIWTESLLETYVKELCIFIQDFPYLRSSACLYIGDLRRYAWLICGAVKYRNLALLCYRKSAKLDEENGIALNQLGLLIQEANPICALLYFLLADNAEVSFVGAYSNVINLLKQQKEEKYITISVLEQCFMCFRQLDFEQLSTKWVEFILTQLETRHALHVAMSINIVALAAVTLLKKGKEIEMQGLTKMFFRVSSITIRNLEEWYASSAEATIFRRRRASSAGEMSASEEEEEKNSMQMSSLDQDVISVHDEADEEEDLVLSKRKHETQHRIQALLVCLLHAATSLAPHVYNDRVPSSVYCEYEDYCQQLIQFLNLLELSLDGGLESFWQLGGPTPWVLLTRFLQNFVKSSFTPVEYEEFFRFTPKNSTKENKMKNMAKLRLAHDAEKEHIRTSLPLYVIPEEDVLLKRLETIKTILRKGKLIVVIAEGTFRSMDMKKDKPEVRKALRWINVRISKDNGRLKIIPKSTPEKCAEKLTTQIPTTSTVFVTILTLSQVEANPVIKPITVENVDDFCARYEKAQKDFSLSN